MTHNKRKEMGFVLAYLERALDVERKITGSIPGAALRKIKEARAIIRKDVMMQKGRSNGKDL